MARTSDDLTPRQRQSQRIMRDKASRKKRKILLRKVSIGFAITVALATAGGGFWVWKSGVVGKAVQTAVNGAYQLTVRAGFSLQSLYLEGRNRTPMEAIDAALNIQKGEAILRLSLAEVKQRLEAIESVKFAAVERSLPDTLYVRIVEREPVALWQNQGKIALVDDNGAVMTGLDIEPYRHLPLIVGVGAPKHVAELIAILAAEPELAKRFAAAVRMGDRRWDMRLADGLQVKLPEHEPAAAWKKLAELQHTEQLLDRDVKVIDLRLPDRLFIKLVPSDMPTGKVANAKDT